MNSKTQQLRTLPAVDEILRQRPVAALADAFPHPMLVQWAREAVDECRKKILAEESLDAADVLSAIVDSVRRSAEYENAQRLQPVINATGVLLHTNLGRAPLPAKAVGRMQDAAGYANVELNLVSGKRSKRGARAARLVAQLAGAEEAVITNNCAGATILVLQAIAAGREVIVSRGQLVEIGGGFRLPDVFASAGVSLREVGTTNRTYLRDYENAITEQTGAIIRVHRSNFAQTGFVTEPSIDEMVSIQRPNDIPVIDDIGSGCFNDLSSLGLHEPTVPASVQSGADLSLFSGDKLFGGPQCGMVVGKRHWIEKLRRSPIMRAVRVDKLTLAALEATTEIHLAGHAKDEIPLLQMMFEQADEIRGRCEQLVSRLNAVGRYRLDVVSCQSQVGGGSIPGTSLPSFGVRVSGDSIDRIATELRCGEPAVQSRVSQDAVLLDLRTVPAEEMDRMTARLASALQKVSGHE